MSAEQNVFYGAEAFLNLFLKQGARSQQVVVRNYGNGTWQQFSGRDLCAHMGRAVETWTSQLGVPLPDRENPATIAILCRASYASLLAPSAAVLAGYDVLMIPGHASKEVIDWCVKHYKVKAIATDIDEMCASFSSYQLPVFNIGKTVWLPQDKHEEPAALKFYRKSIVASSQALDGAPEAVQEENPIHRIGDFKFLSFGHDGFQKPEVLKPDALVLAARNLLSNINAPAATFWKSLELVAPSTPFSFVGRLALLLKNGVIGFQNHAADWETNMRILRPTVLFASPKELEAPVRHIEELSEKPGYKPRIALSAGIDKANTFFESSKVARYGESIFQVAKRGLRIASRAVVGSDFVKAAVEDLRFIVHGLAPAHEVHVGVFERLGIPVIESYGTTATSGVLSSTSFEAPTFNLIGSPLSHVAFRLGNNSTLEYKINSPLFANSGVWQETGDVVQMTARGFAIAGRERHLFVTAGGMTVSPLRLERLLKDSALVGDVCIVGDRMPYLAALIVLSQEASTEFRLDAERIRNEVAEAVAKVNETLPRNVTIKKFQILEKGFQENLGEKLPNGDINRIRIQETRNGLIQELYQ